MANLSEADREAIVNAVVGRLNKTAEQVAKAKVAEALDGVQPTRPLHECSNEELRALGNVLWPAAVSFGGRKGGLK